MRIPNIPETGTLQKHGMDWNENIGNNKKIILKTSMKSFESRRFFWVGRQTDKIGYFFDICCNSMAKWLVGVLDEWWPLIYCEYFMNKNYF
jgi:hypothetical protein